MALDLKPEKLAEYKCGALARWRTEQEALVGRRERAWELARRAAGLLRAEYGATRVVVFGSLIHEGCFTRWSDVDLAAWGLPAEHYLRALGEVLDLDPDVEINLVDMAVCKQPIREVIEQEGVEL